jgi:16S rRNA (guanine527-N7)-methyltransferase
MGRLPDKDRQLLANKLAAGVDMLGLSLGTKQVGLLMDYLALLDKWNATYNLTAIRRPDQMLTHHLLDSLAAVPGFEGAQRVLDVGAGGGLPGIVLAIACPQMQITLIDTVHKKTAFLRQVQAELGLDNVRVQTGRVEQLQVEAPFDVITSRAFAELADFINWSAHLLAPGGCFIAMKGIMPQQEIGSLPPGWQVASVTPLSVPGLDAERHLIIVRAEPS